MGSLKGITENYDGDIVNLLVQAANFYSMGGNRGVMTGNVLLDHQVKDLLVHDTGEILP